MGGEDPEKKRLLAASSQEFKWKTPNTQENPYQRRRETGPQTRHTEEEWEKHRDTILNLFETETLASVTAHLVGLGFHASETQVKIHLRKWGNKKYFTLTGNQFDHVASELVKRKQENKKAALRLNGKKVPSAKVDTAIMKNLERVAKLSTSYSAAGETYIPLISSRFDTFEADPEGYQIWADALSNAPTIVDGTRLSVYTSSTARGISCLGSVLRSTHPSKELAEIDGLDDKEPLSEVAEELTPMGKSRFQDELWGMNDSQSLAANIYDMITTEYSMDFSPDFFNDPCTGKISLVVSEEKLENVVSWQKPELHEDDVQRAREEEIRRSIMDFVMRKHIMGDGEIYKKKICPDDCCDIADILAVDLTPFVRVAATSGSRPASCLVLCVKTR